LIGITSVRQALDRWFASSARRSHIARLALAHVHDRDFVNTTNLTVLTLEHLAARTLAGVERWIEYQLISANVAGFKPTTKAEDNQPEAAD